MNSGLIVLVVTCMALAVVVESSFLKDLLTDEANQKDQDRRHYFADSAFDDSPDLAADVLLDDGWRISPDGKTATKGNPNNYVVIHRDGDKWGDDDDDEMDSDDIYHDMFMDDFD